MMEKKNDIKSTLKRYYTLAHAMTPRKNSPTHGKSAESGDETDRSIDNDITESFFMDEINATTESCSLNSSRENLLDGDTGKEITPSSIIRSRPGSARKTTSKGSELPIDQRIKFLEKGLQEADMEREVVLSCLGKEYLERITMQNYLHEICEKSGYNYDEIVSSIVTQTGAKSLLDNIMESRAKGLLETKENGTEKPQHSTSSIPVRGNLYADKSSGDSVRGKEREKGIDRLDEKQLKEFLSQFTEAEIGKVNSAAKRNDEKVGISHTQNTKDELELSEASIAGSASKQQISGYSFRGGSEKDKERIVSLHKSPNDNSKQPWEPNKVIDSAIHERSVSQHNGISRERPVFIAKQSDDSLTIQANDKQTELIMPENYDHNSVQNRTTSLLRSFELNGLQPSEKSIDSIDEGIFMLKTFLKELQSGSHGVKTNGGSQLYDVQATTEFDLHQEGSVTRPRRKFSLSEESVDGRPSDYRPQRRRSYAEGINVNKRMANDSQTRVESRLFKPTVASKSKAKEKTSKRETDSDTEIGRKSNERRIASLKRSTSDVGYRPRRNLYSKHTAAEEDSSVDGEELDYVDRKNAFHYQVNPGISDREYAKLMSILNMLHEQKTKWDSESKDLKDKLAEERKIRSDLSHDNGVLRKSLEAANRAIKEINSKVQELKLTIVPLREENSKLRDQNQSLKAKLDLLRKDKALLLQEHQELKQRKQRLEKKLGILGELYHSDRLKLFVDDNNNNSNSSAYSDLQPEDLPELFEIDDRLQGEGKVLANRSRNRDFSKRHSFHGFEKIEELAGDAEELLADKEKLEQENQILKEKLKDIEEQIKGSVKKETEKEDDDILNRRRGWRMQREESKQRIIRDILKTESNQVYGRPYASCTNLTLKNEKEDGDAKTTTQFEVGRDCTDEPDSGLRKPRSRGTVGYQLITSDGLLEPKVERNRRSSGEISWKEESDKISKRLQNCKFEKPDAKKDIPLTKEAGLRSEKHAKNKHEHAENEHEKDAGIDEFNDQLDKRAVYTISGYSQPKRTVLDKLERDNGFWKSQNRSVSDCPKVISPDQTKTEISIKSEQKEIARNDIDSFASPQWPLVREKIQAIYEQPVEILQQSLYEKSDFGKSDSKALSDKSLSHHEDVGNAQHISELRGGIYQSSSESRKSHASLEEGGTREPKYFMGLSLNQSAAVERKKFGTKEEFEKGNSNWQRKSASENITSYDDYRRKLRREELESAYIDSEAKENSIQPLAINQDSFNGQSFHDVKSDTTSGIKTMKGSYLNEHVEIMKREEQEDKVVKENGKDLSENKQWRQRENSLWVEVPVYLSNTKKQGHQLMQTPQRQLPQKVERRQLFEPKTELEGERQIGSNEVVASVESSFSSIAVSEKRRGTEKDSKKQKNNFVRQSAGTVLYLDEIADSDSGSSSDVSTTIPRRRSKSFRKSRPKSDILSGYGYGVDENSSRNGGDFRRNRSLRLPNRKKDDMFSVDIYFDGESQDDSAIQMHSDYFNSFKNSETQHKERCEHQNLHHVANFHQSSSARERFYSDSASSSMRSSPRRPKSPGGFSCEMCRELSKKKNTQEKYCWQKYFPIRDTEVEARVIREDYV